VEKWAITKKSSANGFSFSWISPESFYWLFLRKKIKTRRVKVQISTKKRGQEKKIVFSQKLYSKTVNIKVA
jgi:hypothetical protein